MPPDRITYLSEWLVTEKNLILTSRSCKDFLYIFIGFSGLMYLITLTGI